MSMYLEFEPHSWYMGFAIKKAVEPNNHTRILWEGFTDNGNSYTINTEAAYTLTLLKQRVRAYHLKNHNGYGERIAKRRFNYLRKELRAARMSYGEIAELESLTSYIDAGDVELLEAAGVPEFKEEQ